MDKKEFGTLILTIRGCYGNKFQELSDGMMKAWFACLNDLEYQKAEKALYNYAKANPYPPTIADIRREYESISDNERKDRIELRKLYDTTVAIYPCANCDKYVEGVYKSIISGFPESQRIKEARKILNKVSEYVREVELSNKKAMLSLSSFLKEGRWR